MNVILFLFLINPQISKKHVDSNYRGIVNQCIKCEFKASEKGHLGRHIAKLHKKIRAYCLECSFSSAYQRTLKNHSAPVHNNKRLQ